MDRMFIISPSSGVSEPPLDWIVGYAMEAQRMHPNWPSNDCAWEGYHLAKEAANPRHKCWW